MSPSPTPASQVRPAVSTKAKWRLGLLAVVVVTGLLPALFLVVRAFSKPPVMQLALTTNATHALTGSPTDALTILLGNGNHQYYYVGKATPAAGDSLHLITPAQPLRQVIKTWQQRSKSTIFIKPGTQSSYKALVDLLDEMNITGQRSYAVVALTAADRQLLPATEHR